MQRHKTTSTTFVVQHISHHIFLSFSFFTLLRLGEVDTPLSGLRVVRECRVPVLDEGITDHVQVLGGVEVGGGDATHAEDTGSGGAVGDFVTEVALENATGERAEVEIDGVDGKALAGESDGDLRVLGARVGEQLRGRAAAEEGENDGAGDAGVDGGGSDGRGNTGRSTVSYRD